MFIVWLLFISIHSQRPGVPFGKSVLLAIIILFKQGDQIEKIDKNPTVFVNPAQPLIASVEVSSKRVENLSDKVCLQLPSL